MSSHLEIMAKLRKNPEVRNLSRQILKLPTAELKARLRSLNASTFGSKDLRRDRLLRATLWHSGYQDPVPWYGWDNDEESPCELAETSTGNRNAEKTSIQIYGIEADKVPVTKKRSLCDHANRSEYHVNQHSSSKAKAQHQKEKRSKKKIRRLRGRVRSRNRGPSRSFSSNSSRSSRSSSCSSSSSSNSRSSSSSSSSSSSGSSSSGRSNNLNHSRSRARSRSPDSSRSSSRASQSSSSGSRSSSVSSCNSHHLEPEPVRAINTAEPVNYSPTFENCQVCGLKDVTFQDCPNCANIRVLLRKWQRGDKSEVNVFHTVSQQASSSVEKTRHTGSALQRGMPVLGGGVSGPSPLESPGWKLRGKSSGEIAKADITCRPSPLMELGAKSQERFIAAADVTRRPRNLEKVEDEKIIFEVRKKNFVVKEDIIGEEKFFVEEEEKLFVEEENFCRRENTFVQEDTFFVDVGITCRPKQEVVVEEAEEQKIFANAGVTRRLSNRTSAGATTARPSSSEAENEKSDSAVRWNLNVIPTSRVSSPMITDQFEDMKAQPVMLSPAANSHGRIRETLAQDKRKNESDEEPTFLPLTKLQTRTPSQPVLQPDQVNRQDASSTSACQLDGTTKKCWESFMNEEKVLCSRRVLECVEEKKTYANADATRRLSNVPVTKPRTIASAVTAWPSSSDEEGEESSRCRVVKLYRSVIPTSINNCLSSHKVADRQEDTNVPPVQLKSAVHRRGRIMEALAQDEKKNESGENPRFSSISILQPRAHFQPVSQPEQQRQGDSSTSDVWPDNAITEVRKTAFVDVEEVLEQDDVEDVQGVPAREGREGSVTKNNTVVVLEPAREIEVVEEDVRVVKIVEPKVNLATLDRVSGGADRSFAVPEESCLDGKIPVRSTTVEDVLQPNMSRIRAARQRITNRLTAVNDVTILRRILYRMKKILNEDIDDQSEKKFVKSTMEEKMMDDDVDDQTEKVFVGSRIELEREDTFEHPREVISAQALTAIKPGEPEVQHSCREPDHEEEGAFSAKEERGIFVWIEVNHRIVFDRGKILDKIYSLVTSILANNKDAWPMDLRRAAYRALFDRGRSHSQSIKLQNIPNAEATWETTSYTSWLSSRGRIEDVPQTTRPTSQSRDRLVQWTELLTRDSRTYYTNTM